MSGAVSRAEGIGAGVVGLGVHLPETVRTNAWWPETWRRHHEELLQRDITGTIDAAARRGGDDIDPEVARYIGPYLRDPFRGAKARRVIDPGTVPSQMEASACRAALADAGVDPSEVDALFGFSLVADHAVLENTGIVADRLGLRADVAAMEVRAACASFLHQVRLASRMVVAGEFDTALVYVSSAASLVTDYDVPSSVIPSDGAAAAVIRRVEPGFGYVASTASTQGELHKAIMCLPRQAPEAPWFRGEGGPLQIRRVDAHAAHLAGARAASACREPVRRLFDQTGYGSEDVAFFAVSQAGAWFGRALADAIGVDHSRILAPEEHFEPYGHMFAASAPLNLHLARKLGRVKKGDLVLMFSPGVGFVTAASLFRWSLDG